MSKTNRLNGEQEKLLEELGEGISKEEVLAIASGAVHLSMLDTERLLGFLKVANGLYRAGHPLISDHDYDHLYLAELKRRDPEHPWLQTVEPEPHQAAKTVALPSRMLSTDKAYDFDTVKRWAERVEKAAKEIGLVFEDLVFRATPKLDGFAAWDDGTTLYTRGDGRRGTDITRAFDRGLQVADGGARGLGPGEIVVSRSYFAEKLSAHFENSRNFQASLLREKELDEVTAETLRRGKAVFYPFVLLPNWQGGWRELEADFEQIVSRLWNVLDYDVDGIVFEVLGDTLRRHMGATRHHHRWQIAYKQNTEFAEVRVVEVVPQTSRSGRINPVAEVEPVRLSGAVIRRATAHHYQMVREQGIGPGALIRLLRSGEVIPKIDAVLEPGRVEIPENCPSCDSGLVWDSDYLFCPNTMYCPAQITTAIEHFFKMLGNVDGFGPASIEKLYANGIRSIAEIYGMDAEAFERCGFGPKQSENMVAQLQRSRREAIEDWRFLAAFGILRMGPGNCERLLEHYRLDEVFGLGLEQIVEIRGFSDRSAEGVVEGLRNIRPVFRQLYALGFNLVETRRQGEEGGGVVAEDSASPLAGKTLVFTGKMVSGSREEMKQQAKRLGARVGSSVSSKTDFLICGENVGAAKLQKAEKLGVRTLTEQEYLEMAGGNG